MRWYRPTHTHTQRRIDTHKADSSLVICVWLYTPCFAVNTQAIHASQPWEWAREQKSQLFNKKKRKKEKKSREHTPTYRVRRAWAQWYCTLCFTCFISFSVVLKYYFFAIPYQFSSPILFMHYDTMQLNVLHIRHQTFLWSFTIVLKYHDMFCMVKSMPITSLTSLIQNKLIWN